MTLLGLILWLLVFIILMWAIQQIDMTPATRQLVRIVVVVVVVVWLVSMLLDHPFLNHYNHRFW